jgi:hypothetical protein
VPLLVTHNSSLPLIRQIRGVTEIDGEYFGKFPAKVKWVKDAVTIINLHKAPGPGFGIIGSLPTQLGTFRVMTNFALHENDVTGSLPTEIGSLNAALDVAFEIWGNPEISGVLPTELGSLTGISESFVLDGMKGLASRGIPTEIGRLSRLQNRLSISNTLSTNEDIKSGLAGSIPTELGQLIGLEELNLEGNNFSGSLPTELGMLSSLKRGFIISNNKLEGVVPTELGKFSTLKV